MLTGGPDALRETDLSLEGKRSGKVRDVYALPPSDGCARLLVVATDRISAFDVVMPTAIGGKGRVLTAISKRWFRFVSEQGICGTHLIADTVVGEASMTAADRELVEGRAMVCRACRIVPVECVVRGYLDGSGWKDYQATGTVCGVELPTGLQRGDRLPEPIFTPATKAEEGHDENISFEESGAHADAVAREGGICGDALMDRLRGKSIEIYTAAHAYAKTRGLMLADTKFEFGLPLDEGGEVLRGAEAIVADEALTPDSSRYWDSSKWEPGRAQESFDKQFVREYLQGLVDRGEWDKGPVGETGLGPALPGDVVAGTRVRYEEALRKLWGV